MGWKSKIQLPPQSIQIDTTSRSTNWSRGLSPFVIGPIELYDNHASKNFENSWQFSKVYKNHTDVDGNPTSDYWSWAKAGWADNYAHRYPMGKGAVPQYSFWAGKKLSYIEARKQIYIPLYAKAVQKTEAWKILLNESVKNQNVYLLDFDGYDRGDMTYEDVINCEDKKMGHAFVLAMLLDGYIK